MDLITRTPTLTGVAVGGTMIRPQPALLVNLTDMLLVNLRTQWICRITLAPPIEGDIPNTAPTLHTTRAVSPAAA